jgi:hypothetical protein
MSVLPTLSETEQNEGVQGRVLEVTSLEGDLTDAAMSDDYTSCAIGSQNLNQPLAESLATLEPLEEHPKGIQCPVVAEEKVTQTVPLESDAVVCDATKDQGGHEMPLEARIVQERAEPLAVIDQEEGLRSPVAANTELAQIENQAANTELDLKTQDEPLSLCNSHEVTDCNTIAGDLTANESWGRCDLVESFDLFSVESLQARKDKRLIILDGIIAGIPMSIMADTGASTRYISTKAARAAGWKPKEGTQRHVRVADGRRLPIYGTFSCKLHLDSVGVRVDFTEFAEYMVIDMEPYDVILGMDFWKQWRAQVDWDLGGLRVWKNKKSYSLPLAAIHSAPELTVHTLDSTEYNPISDIASITWRKAQKLLEKGCGGCLFMVLATKQDQETLSQVTESVNATDQAYQNAIRDITKQFQSVLRNELPEGIQASTHGVEHHIDTQDARPANLPAYRLNPLQFTEQTKQVEDLLQKGLIRHSKSPWGAPVLFVRKPDGSWRMCVDYRVLNASTIRNGFPLPRIQELIDQVGHATTYTKIDLLSGFWQLPMAKDSIEKTAFNTRDGKYEFLVMPFGLTNAPPTFQATMNQIFRKVLNKFVVVYLDDILIYSKTKKEHLEHIQQVLLILREAGLYAKPSKCVFGVSEVEFCGHMVGNGKVRMLQDKIQAITDWPQPTTVHHARQFLGLCSYYRRYIKNFAHIAAPLHGLLATEGTNKHRSIQWAYGCEVAFRELKDKISDSPVLLQPDTTKPFIIETDASDFAQGAQLLQVGTDGKEHPVAYHSRKFSPAERNYPTHERELLAIKDAIRAWDHYIQNGHTTIVRTDHAGLQYMHTTKVLSKRLARWLDEFQAYDLDIRYKPGSQMIVPDALSRRPDLTEPSSNAPESLNQLTLSLVDVTDYMQDYIRYGTLPDTTEDARYIESVASKFRYEDELQHRDSPQQPWTTVLPLWSRADTLDSFHRTYGHCNEVTLFGLLKDRYWWPTLKQDVRNYCRYCKECQLTQQRHENQTLAPLAPSTKWSSAALQPFDRWGLDLIGVLPKTKGGKKWIVTAVDYATRWPVAQALDEATAENLAEFVFQLYLNYGAPKEIVTDQGGNLWAEAMDTFFTKLGTRHTGTTAYHPRTNGAVESLNKVLGKALSKYLVGKSRHSWDDYLNQALFAARVRIHSTTKQSPFFLLYGRDARLPTDMNPLLSDNLDDDATRLPLLETARQEARRLATERDDANKAQWAKDHPSILSGAGKFQEGEYVLVRNQAKKKFDPNWYGPYKVVTERFPNTYRLREVRNGKDGKIVERLITGDRLHKARVNGQLIRGWNMPVGKGKKRVYGSQLQPQLPITVPDDTIIVEIPDLDLEEGSTDTTAMLEPQV